MKEQCIARVHRHVDYLKPLPCLLDPFQVRARLITGKNVVHSAQLVRALHHLEAAVFTGRRINGHHHAAQIRIEHTILVPVPVVLVPGPCATDLGVLEDHLGMVMVNLPAQQLLDGVHYPVAAGEHPVNPVTRMIPEGQPNIVATAVVHRRRCLVHGVVMVGRLTKQTGLLGCEEATHNDVAVALVVGNLLGRKPGHTNGMFKG